VFLNPFCKANIIETGVETVDCRASTGSWRRIAEVAMEESMRLSKAFTP
jgi:hypothetical protein